MTGVILAELEFSQFLEDVSAEAPCGENLEYDPVLQEIERESEGVPKQQMGDSTLPAEEADWKSIRRKSLQLLERTRDIQVTMYLTRALTHTEGLEGANQGLTLLYGLLDKYWDCVYPLQDPDDDYPVLRMNAMYALNDYDTFLKPIRSAPLTESRVMGRFTLTDIEHAAGKSSIDAKDDSDIPKQSEIDAAFMDTELSHLENKRDNVELALSQVEAISALTTERVGAVNAPNFDALIALLKELKQVLNAQVERCGGISSDAEDETGEMGATGETAARGTPGSINSRKDVDQAIDAICDYFDRYDPSSPVPFILKRAKRLLFKDFKEILHDLAPDGISQAENIFGKDMEDR
jgi:type VI secretion system protein ImpA